jgi:hypothetical protein
MRGRKRKPTQLHVIEGTFNATRHKDRAKEGGFKRWSQHLGGGGCDEQAEAAIGSVWTQALAVAGSAGHLPAWARVLAIATLVTRPGASRGPPLS